MNCDYEEQYKFMFYTYDNVGRDVVLSVNASTRGKAIKEFDKVYGSDTPVDFIIKSDNPI